MLNYSVARATLRPHELDTVDAKAPCPASWEEMPGTAQSHYVGRRLDGTLILDNCSPRLRPNRALAIKHLAALASFGLLLLSYPSQLAYALQKQTAAPRTSARKSGMKGTGKKLPHGKGKTTAALKGNAGSGTKAKPAPPGAATQDADKSTNATVFGTGQRVHF